MNDPTAPPETSWLAPLTKAVSGITPFRVWSTPGAVSRGTTLLDAAIWTSRNNTENSIAIPTGPHRSRMATASTAKVTEASSTEQRRRDDRRRAGVEHHDGDHDGRGAQGGKAQQRQGLSQGHGPGGDRRHRVPGDRGEIEAQGGNEGREPQDQPDDHRDRPAIAVLAVLHRAGQHDGLASTGVSALLLLVGVLRALRGPAGQPTARLRSASSAWLALDASVLLPEASEDPASAVERVPLASCPAGVEPRGALRERGRPLDQAVRARAEPTAGVTEGVGRGGHAGRASRQPPGAVGD